MCSDSKILMATHAATAVVPSTGSQVVQTLPSAITKSAPHGSVSTMSAVSPSPGRFRHPRMAEIAKRRSAASFTSKNIQTVLLNAVVLIGTFLANSWAYPLLDALVHNAHLDTIALDSSMMLNLVRLILASNIYFALRPVLPYVSSSDPIEDIPLTPSQRALLGLPLSQSNTPGSARGGTEASYITPPRYRRTSPSPFAGTPLSNGTDRRSVSANYSASPLSTSRYTVGFSPTPQQPTTTPGRRFSGSPFSPSSPLFSKALINSSSVGDIAQNADFTESTRSLLAGNTSTSSFQNSLRRSHSMRERGRQQEPGTPSPGMRDKNKVNVQPGLNYKWLYEKGLKVGKGGNIEY